MIFEFDQHGGHRVIAEDDDDDADVVPDGGHIRQPLMLMDGTDAGDARHVDAREAAYNRMKERLVNAHRAPLPLPTHSDASHSGTESVSKRDTQAERRDGVDAVAAARERYVARLCEAHRNP